MTQRQFIKHIDASEITDQTVADLYSGAVSLYVIDNADENTVDRFGDLLDQDMYGRKRVTIGIEDEKGEKLNHSTDMLWHQDRAYSKSCHPYVGLYCIRADEGSSATWFADMQQAYESSSEDLKQRAANTNCLNTITKYMSQEQYPYEFKSPVQERAWRMKNRAEHPLVWEDSTGKYYFYSEAYTETDMEPELQAAMQATDHYKHMWKPRQLLVYNNYKTVHKRDATPESVVRQHIRYAIAEAST